MIGYFNRKMPTGPMRTLIRTMARLGRVNTVGKSGRAPAQAFIPVGFEFMFVRVIGREVLGLVALSFVINPGDNLILTPNPSRWRVLPQPSADILIIWATGIWMLKVIWQHGRL